MPVTKIIRETRPRSRFARSMRVLRRQRAPSNKNLDKKIKKLQSDQELHYVDTQLTAQTMPVAGALILLNGSAKGTTDTTRVGSEIIATSIQFRLLFSANPAQLSSSIVRMIIFWDAQANGAVPIASGANGLLDTSVINTPIYAPYNQDTQKRYKVLYDKVSTLNPVLAGQTDNATPDQLGLVVDVGKFVRSKRKLSRQVKYNDVGATDVTAIVTNSLYALFLSNATEIPNVTGGFRFIFKD